MLFNSWQYLLFLPLVVLVYYLLPQRFRWMWLLAASYYFYMSWNAKLVVLIFTTTFTSWGASMLIERSAAKGRKRLWLILAAVVSLGILAFFKYFNFFTESLAALFALIGLPVDPFIVSLLLPVGISFYTFQTLGYVIDVYRGTIPAEKHFGIYALFVSFFPQLVAGPIERASNLLPQFREVHTPKPEAFSWGLRYICWGLIKKVAIADTLAGYVDKVYANPSEYNAVGAVLATVMFAIQIYCDFSGYSDMARGSASLLGFRLMENFNAPYFARSIREFWRRWHISLSTWFMDYVYIPLGGNRVKYWRHLLNLLITFTLSGLWHGAKWTFVIWGLYHGILTVISTLWGQVRKRVNAHVTSTALKALFATVGTLVTLFLVCIGWVFFRANSVPAALQIITSFPHVLVHPLADLRSTLAQLEISGDMLLRISFVVGLLIGFDAMVYYVKGDPFTRLSHQKAPLRIAVSYGMALLVVVWLLTTPELTSMSFIYFQF